MTSFQARWITSLIVTAIAGCGVPDDNSYTLYRSSVSDSTMRLHLATFDASEGDKYNQENCDRARQLFQAQKGIRTRLWCEKGRYQK